MTRALPSAAAIIIRQQREDPHNRVCLYSLIALEPARHPASPPEEADQELPNAPDAEIPPVPLTRFTSRMRLPVRDLVACSPQGHLSQAHDADRAPAPVDLPDSHAFYLRMPGHSMVPAGIWPGDFCLVSPCVRLETRQRVWFRNREDQETIRVAGSAPPQMLRARWLEPA